MQKEKSKKIVSVVVVVLVVIVAFYGGTVYGKSRTGSANAARQAFGNRSGRTGAGNLGGMGGFTGGQIISKDDKSITVSLMTGGSKIIFLDSNTKISKQAAGTAADLTVGTQVTVTGAANTDGSMNAQMVQIRPMMPQSAKVQ